MDFDDRRRDFLKQSAYMGGGLLGFGSAGGVSNFLSRASLSLRAASEPKSRVVILQNDRVRGKNGEIDKDVLRHMLDVALGRLTGAGSARMAWGHFCTPKDVVGIKVNCLAGKGLSTHPELVEGIVAGLTSAGIKEKNIIIWDRLTEDLKRAGFQINMNGNGVRCYGTDAPGADYERQLTIIGSVGSRLSRILTRQCTAMINVPVLKDHSIAGVSVSLKNLFGAIDNPNKYHLDGCNPYVADLCAAKAITDKSRLIICDALTAQYEGGPPYMPQWAWPFNGILVGTDPVALDQVGYGILERKRREKGLLSLAEAGREPEYIATAADAQHRLGRCDPRMIEEIHVQS
ncbi:MAG: DUF362 domain-containing protein [Gemmatimonadota bacterium]|nr:MAG: DUF362 domain-containing protein [Gemmatimonadota bacterium]